MKGKTFKLGIILLIVVVGAGFSSAVFSQSKELPLVRASHQPCMHALPTILATFAFFRATRRSRSASVIRVRNAKGQAVAKAD